MTSNGYGKRTDPDEYREQGRGGKGIRAMNLTEKTGEMAAMLFVHEEEDILLITDDGTIIRARAADIRVCGRATQGVRLMRLAEGSQVVAVCRAEKEEENETGENPEESGLISPVEQELEAELKGEEPLEEEAETETGADALDDLSMDLPENEETEEPEEP